MKESKGFKGWVEECNGLGGTLTCVTVVHIEVFLEVGKLNKSYINKEL
jgi:hypothetical protein